MKRTILLLAALAVVAAGYGGTWDEEWARVYEDRKLAQEFANWRFPGKYTTVEVNHPNYYFIVLFHGTYSSAYILEKTEEHPDGKFSTTSNYFFYGFYEVSPSDSYKDADAALEATRAAAAEWAAKVTALKKTIGTPVLIATGVEAIDGDTFRVETAGGTVEKVRLIGVDAPEMDGPEPEVAAQAKDYLAKLVEGEAVRLVLGVEGRDRYDRLLAYVFVDDDKDKRYSYNEDDFWFIGFVNEAMLSAGLARVYTVEPDIGYVRDYEWAEHDARKAEIGIWEPRENWAENEFGLTLDEVKALKDMVEVEKEYGKLSLDVLTRYAGVREKFIELGLLELKKVRWYHKLDKNRDKYPKYRVTDKGYEVYEKLMDETRAISENPE